MEIIGGYGFTFLPSWLTNFVAACGLACSMVAYGGLRWRLWGLLVRHERDRGGVLWGKKKFLRRCTSIFNVPGLRACFSDRQHFNAIFQDNLNQSHVLGSSCNFLLNFSKLCICRKNFHVIHDIKPLSCPLNLISTDNQKLNTHLLVASVFHVINGNFYKPFQQHQTQPYLVINILHS